jgi:hypothetical protein
MNPDQKKNRPRASRKPYSLSSIDAPLNRIEAVARLAEAWLTPSSRWMQKACREIPKHSVFSKEMVRACLNTTFQEYHLEGLTRSFHQIIRDHSKKTKRKSIPSILLIPPSTVFAATWQAAVPVWLTGARLIIKPSRREPTFPKILQESVRAVSPELSLILKHRIPTNAAATIVYGSDATIQNLKKRRLKTVIGFDTRISDAVIGKKVTNPAKLIRSAALDSVLYESQGCLSPQCFYVENGGRLTADQFARKLSDAIGKLAQSIPSSPGQNKALDEESFWQHWQFRSSQGSARIYGRHVILNRVHSFEPTGLARVVFVVPISNISEIPQHCGAWTRRISTVAISDSSATPKLKRVLGKEVRFCAVGMMHQPEPGWRNGGVDLLGKLEAVSKL